MNSDIVMKGTIIGSKTSEIKSIIFEPLSVLKKLEIVCNCKKRFHKPALVRICEKVPVFLRKNKRFFKNILFFSSDMQGFHFQKTSQSAGETSYSNYNLFRPEEYKCAPLFFSS